MTDTRDEVERIRLRARGGVTMWSDADVQNLLARIATLEAERDAARRSIDDWQRAAHNLMTERDALAARLPSPAAVRAARTKAAEIVETMLCDAYYPSVIAARIRDIADGHSGRHDQGGDVDEPTMLVIAQRVARCTTLGELEEMARELREVE